MLTNNTRIFVDCHVFDKGFQGTRTYIQGLYFELIKEKDKHFFLAAQEINILEATFGKAENITFIKYSSKSAFFRLLIEIPYLLRKNKIAFAHFQYRVPPIKVCKYIVTTHDVLFEDFPEYFPKLNRFQSFITYKISAKMADIIFTVSDYSKKQIEKHLKVSNVIVMPNGVDAVFFEDYKKDQIQKNVLEQFKVANYLIYVSRWEPRKNHDMVLKSFVELELYKNHQLVFIGDDTFTNKAYQEYYNSLDNTVKSKIINLKRVGFSTMIMLLRGAKASVYPSIAEGFGIPPLESIAAKIPTITSDATAMSDFNFLDGYTFNPLDANDFKERLKMVLQEGDPQINEKRVIINERYNWALSARIFNETIKKN